jgi:hypothetical protein
MSKPLKFHQTLNQAPRSMKNGQHRRASAPAYGRPLDRADHGARGAVTFPSAFLTWDIAKAEPPQPPTIPYAGIRTGEIIGHRLWWVIGSSICSLAHDRIWLPDETISADTNECICDGPIYRIWGGTYAFASRERCENEARFLLEMRGFQWGVPVFAGWMIAVDGFVAGTVKMWGDVVEHETGYRAQFAKLRSLDAVYGEGDLDALRNRYGVFTT